MNTRFRFLLFLLPILLLFLSFAPIAQAQDDPTPTPPSADNRPLIVLDSYSTGFSSINPGQTFDLDLQLHNIGQHGAVNIIAVFSSAEFFPKDTGAVVALNHIPPTGDRTITQPFTTATDLWGKTVGIINVQLSYNEEDTGIPYTASFTISIDLNQPVYNPKPTATATVVNVVRPQLVVDSYSSNVEILQPGTIFNLDLEVRNLGNANAKAVTMVLGGGASVSADASGTPQPGGVSGSGADLTNFAPLGTSNLVYLGDIPQGSTASAAPSLIVSVAANPGAYPFKLSFVYTDEKGNRIVDDQAITLLIYTLPVIEVGFYRPPDPFFNGMLGQLPLQVTNLGRKSAVLGNLQVRTENGELTNNIALVGALEPGGYFTLDSNLMPYSAGPLDLQITINYTDDFNQLRSISQTLTVDVQEMEMPTPDPGFDPNAPIEPPTSQETLWQKIVRFFKGLLGLGSQAPQPDIWVDPLPEELPQPMPMPAPGGKG